MGNIHIDHIDPRWEKGRDYQLVCGRDVESNYCERDPSLNQTKNNRFIPWRVCHDEIGTVPIEQGDLCLFLDYNTHEWVLEEFMGTWWYEHSKLWGFSKTQPQREETKRKRAEKQIGRKHSAATRLKCSLAKRGRKHSEETKRKISETIRRNAARDRCRRMSFSDPQMPNFED